MRWYQASITFSAREMASRRSPETIPFRGFGVCTVQTHWSRPGAILTAYSMCRCSISSPEGCAWELVALCKYRPSAPLWRRSVHNCSSFPDRAIVLGARHATYDTCQPIGWTIGGDPNPGASSHVALCADVASSGDNHFDRCDLLHHRIIHDSARKAVAGLRISASRQAFGLRKHALAGCVGAPLRRGQARFAGRQRIGVTPA